MEKIAVSMPLGGAGSRWAPATPTHVKPLIPMAVGETPVMPIDLMLAECDAPRVVMVTTQRGEKAFRDYLDPERLDQDFTAQCRSLGKNALVEAEENRREFYGQRPSGGLRKLEYATQRPKDGYGTTVPFYIACRALSKRRFPFIGQKGRFTLKDPSEEVWAMGGDDALVSLRADEESELQRAREARDSNGADHVIMGVPVDRSVAGNYGNLVADDEGRLQRLVEKPSAEQIKEMYPDEATDPIASVSRIGLRIAKIWPLVKAEMRQKRTGKDEHFLTNVISAALADGQTFYIHQVDETAGIYCDMGTLPAAQKTARYLTSNRPAAHLLPYPVR
ncbi:MAG TPA: sugar phosphate nucleotidyltransferase [Candidatus Limnocylindria bacterium]|nr:sugar phosphate nucleotidyltransferase [Candidatus Limnocylindria bacterium]